MIKPSILQATLPLFIIVVLAGLIKKSSRGSLNWSEVVFVRWRRHYIPWYK